MTRAKVVEKARKLDELARRTSYAGERRAAREALLRLVVRHGIGPDEYAPKPLAERPRSWTAPTHGPAKRWYFNPLTGEGSANVKVHAYRNRANWRIEVPIEAEYGGYKQRALRELR